MSDEQDQDVNGAEQRPEDAPVAETPATEAQAPQDQAPAEGHAVPTEEAQEIASEVEDAPLEARQEADERAAAQEQAPQQEQAAQEQAAQQQEPAPQAEPSADTGETAAAASADEDADEGETPARAEKPVVPGAHLEVDIVPEGADPLGREEAYVDPYADESDEGATPVAVEGEDTDEPLPQPISTAAIDLAAGARYRATGKRKTAIARVTLRPGTGAYLVNGRPLEQHFPRVTLQRNIRQPLETVGYEDRMDVVARLHGGGISAQAGALRHGVSRALLEADPNLRGELKRRGFLTRDSRAKERKKAGLKKARKRPQFSKR